MIGQGQVSVADQSLTDVPGKFGPGHLLSLAAGSFTVIHLARLEAPIGVPSPLVRGDGSTTLTDGS